MQNISVITLGVGDFGRSPAFCRDGIGWKTSATEEDGIAFFDMNGAVLALYPREALAEDAQAEDPGDGFHAVTLAHDVGSISEVDELFAGVERIGAKILKKPEKTSWGVYSG